MVNVKRYIVHRSPDQVRLAFGFILKLCQSEEISDVRLIVPQKGGWERTIVAEFLGRHVAKSLLSGRRVSLREGVTMTLESTRTFQPHSRGGLLVGAHVSLKEMSRLDDSWETQAIIYLPWIDEEAKEWQATWQPEIVGSTAEKPPDVGLPDPVEEALSRLTQSINLGTGLAHPSDKRHAERVIADLRAAGHSYDPADIRRWAQRNGWDSKAAGDLEAIARRRQ